MKKIFFSTSIVLALALFALIGYYYMSPKNSGGDNKSGNIFKNFFPFGGETGAENTGTSTENSNNNEIVQTPTTTPIFDQKLRKISSEQVSGAGSADYKAGTVVRYMERSTGHIYEAELFSPKVVRISNTTIPVAYNALWNQKNDMLVSQYLTDDLKIETYSFKIKISSSTESTIAGTALPKGISDISSTDNSIFYLINDNVSSSGFVTNFDGSKTKKIWSSDIKNLNSQYINSSIVALTTKPAQNIHGYSYFVNTNTGAVKKVIGGVAGLSTLASPDSNKILYISQYSDVNMFVFDQQKNSTIKVTPSTFPEKCVWSKQNKDTLYCAVPKSVIDGTSLTLWYKGLSAYIDDIWKYDLKNNTSSIIADLYDESGEEIDVIKPSLSTNEKYLIFINKKDNSLWSLDLTK